MNLELPQEQLDKALREDALVSKLTREIEGLISRHSEKEQERARESERLYRESIRLRKESKAMLTESGRLRRRSVTLAKKKPVPHLPELKRRLLNRKNTIRKRELDKFLATQRNNFLKYWDQRQGI
tara:strand:+ start:1813 stop:2190 length:378 start_codon:yes stop_codon:yes gene_type:complete